MTTTRRPDLAKNEEPQIPPRWEGYDDLSNLIRLFEEDRTQSQVPPLPAPRQTTP